MKLLSLSLIALAALSAVAVAAPPAPRSVSLTQEPLIMRLNKDEFRIAFGINGEACDLNGCSGTIRYRVDLWGEQELPPEGVLSQLGCVPRSQCVGSRAWGGVPSRNKGCCGAARRGHATR